MGRHYHGSIQGRFVFAVQDSDDINNLVAISPEMSYMWKVCLCTANIEDDDYCTDCYASKKEHEDAVIEDDITDEENCLYIEEQTMSYYLDKDSHYDELKNNMDKLKLKIYPKIIDEFDKIEQNDNILDAFTGVFDNTITKLNEIEKEKKEIEKEKREIEKEKKDNKLNKSTGILYIYQQIFNAFTDMFVDKDDKLDTTLKEIEHDLSKHKTYNDNRAFVARYTLGYQLEYCLRTTDGDCYIHCEC
tara:strand:- start:16 stop:753 length:738 start_codon:yes stop_codon:yes gene_type:complete